MSRGVSTLARRTLALSVGVALGAMLLATTAAGIARAAAPWWQLGYEQSPSTISPTAGGLVVVQLSNLGDQAIDGSTTPATLSVHLPNGLSAISMSGVTKNGAATQCVVGTLTCTFKGVLNPYEQLPVSIRVKAALTASTNAALTAKAEVSGGEAQPASRTFPIHISSEPPSFGVAAYELFPYNEDGTPDTKAGSHPFQLTTTFALNQEAGQQPVALPDNMSFLLPPGLVGNPTATSQCTMSDFFSLVDETNLCTPGSVVGVAAVAANEPKIFHVFGRSVPIFNLVPAQGEPARFGFEVLGKVPVVIDTSVRTGRDYGVVVSTPETTQTAGLLSAQATFWGVPGDPRHDSARGWECVAGGYFATQIGKSCPETSDPEQTALLTLPTACAASPASEPVDSSVEADSWLQPGITVGQGYEWLSQAGERLGFEGCDELPFAPVLSVSPEQHAAASPTGMTVDVRIPQPGLLAANGIAPADVRDTTLTLPPGVELSPAAANGLAACTEAEAGFEGISFGGMQLFSAREAACPAAAKVAVVHIKTPLLPHELEGAMYVASPAPNGEAGRNPFNSLVALYLVARDPTSGVLVKLAGEGHVDGTTGQVSTTFAETPQVPFEDLKVELLGGPRASVSTPASCGGYSATGVLTPWSGASPVTMDSGFSVDAGAGNTPCPSNPPFAPTFSAKSQNTQAGAFTPFSVDIGRPDGDQALTGVSVHLPAGIAALLSTVTPCPEPPTGVEWSCGEASLIGHSVAWSGLGSEPVALPGDVYLTTGYDGAPFGILVRTHAAAGPFDLGYVNVRSRISVNPRDASVTITTDPGPHGDVLPVRLKGIPAQIKALQITVDRPHFEFNPTSCDPTAITAALSGDHGATSPVSSRFQVGGCASLPFAPKLTASVTGKGSRADGTGFKVRLESAGVGQANIHKVLLQLPKALPSRLETLKKACLAATFEANPATCNPESVIGTATIHTPVLNTPLTGPAYLVSHGNASFPDVEFVLQGEGIVLVVDGQTDIKGGVTYSKFETAPDAPFTTFETVLPAGPKSVLAIYNTANSIEPYSACGTKLVMPTTMISQSNKVIETETPVTTTGCSGVRNNKTTRLSLHQRYLKALQACRNRYKHNGGKRATCEHKAHTTYTARALSACRRTHKGTHTRERCETAARRTYALRHP